MHARSHGQKWLVLAALCLTGCSADGQITAASPSAAISPAPTAMQDSVWRYSIDNGQTFTEALVIPPDATAMQVLAVTEFDAPEAGDVVAWQLTHNVAGGNVSVLFNGKPIQGPMPGMLYRTIPAIDPGLVRAGRNRVQAQTEFTNPAPKDGEATAKPFTMEMSLAGLTNQDLRIQTGPILGAAEKGAYTLTLRTNLPATVTVVNGAAGVGKTLATSATGLIHRLQVKLDPASSNQEHTLVYARPGCTRTEVIAVPELARSGGEGKIRFVAMGDSRTNPKDWQSVAEAVVKAEPLLVVFGGDMVVRGTLDWVWDSDFFGPSRALFASIPFYPVIGNHEANASLYNEIFYTPGGDGRLRNWSQTIGDTLLIGIDPGGSGWKEESGQFAWLEQTLGASDAKFIFLTSHYPAWTSGGHGRLKDGRPVEGAVRQGQDRLMPLLQKYQVTAMLAGHDHIYERSEPPGGVSHIITGGAGAPRYKKAAGAEQQNPHSTVFVAELHYCLFEIDGDTCTMQAITPDGRVIDTRTFAARVRNPVGR